MSDHPPAEPDPRATPAAPETPPPASEALGAALGGAARRAGLDPTRHGSTGAAVWAAMGGWRGILESVLPGLAFVLLFTLTYDPEARQGNLWISLGVSVGIAVVFTVVRLAQRSPAGAALGGLIATGAAAALALWTGQGRDNFLLGFLTNGLYGSAFLVSALVGWPLIGLAVGFLMNEGTRWRRNARKRRVFFWLSVAWAAMFALRLAVQLPLYLADATAALGITKIAMGLPLFAPLVAVTWLAVRAVYPTRQT